jgi:hypothetical protein
MKTFDYIRAWDRIAYPAWQTLSPDIKALVLRTHVVAKDLGQGDDLQMLWPEVLKTRVHFRMSFEDFTSADLAFAARVVNALGHWYHARAEHQEPWLDDRLGTHWKFARYCDQVLQARLQIPQPVGSSTTGFGLEIHEGAIRLTYASTRSWSWREVAVATEEGKTLAEQIKADSQRRISNINRSWAARRDREAWTYMEYLKSPGVIDWPEPWRPFMNLEPMMIDEEEFKAREAQHPDVKEQTVKALITRHQKQVAELDTELAGKIWLLNHGQDLSNWIYYAHTETFTCGWYRPVSPERLEVIRRQVAGIPWKATVKVEGQGEVTLTTTGMALHTETKIHG